MKTILLLALVAYLAILNTFTLMAVKLVHKTPVIEEVWCEGMVTAKYHTGSLLRQNGAWQSDFVNPYDPSEIGRFWIHVESLEGESKIVEVPRYVWDYISKETRYTCQSKEESIIDEFDLKQAG